MYEFYVEGSMILTHLDFY